jgi:3-hydroxyacyl-CoA dehydrogenase
MTVKQPNVRKARGQVEKAIAPVTRSISQIQIALRRAERKIEADAQARIRQLRKDAKKQIASLRGHEQEARRILGRLSTAAEGSWGDIKRAAGRAVMDAKTVADSMTERFRGAIG